MTRKDYKMIAGIINYSFRGADMANMKKIVKARMIDCFCVHLKRDNPRFDMHKFKTACYGEDNNI